MYQPARERPEHLRRGGMLETMCAVVVLLAVALLVAWFVTHAGGRVLNPG